MSKACDFPNDLTEWTKDHVKSWVTHQLKLDQKHGEILYNEDVNGMILMELTKADLKDMGIKGGPAAVIKNKCDEIIKRSKKATNSPTTNKSFCPGISGSDCKVPEFRGAGGQNDKSVSLDLTMNPSQKEYNKKNSALHEVAQPNTGTTKSEESGTKLQECSQEKIDPVAETPLATVSGAKKDQQQSEKSTSKPRCEPYPFDQSDVGSRYIQAYVLPPETGPSNLIDPVHEFKLFTVSENETNQEILQDMMKKFSNEVFRFSAACMNSRTNGTIHFGVGDTKSGYEHGEIIGVSVDSMDKYVDCLCNNFVLYFDQKDVESAKSCIRPPRFVEVLNPDQTLLRKFVIEVDVVPSSYTCGSTLYYIHMQIKPDKKWMKSKEKHFFIRDGSSSRDILKQKNITERNAEHCRFLTEKLVTLEKERKIAEEKPRRPTKRQDGYNLRRMITGGSDMLDSSYYQWYILVTNKSQQDQNQHLEFLREVNLFCVLEYDPESVISGVCNSFRKERIVNLHIPSQFQNIDASIHENIEKLKLYKQISWIFCNGRSDIEDPIFKPMPPNQWYKDRAADIRKLISFLCRSDIMPKGRFLVIFLLLSKVDDQRDPFLETFCSFYQEMNGVEDILCICESEQTFLRWKDLVQCRCDPQEVTDRCVSALSLGEVNNTVLKLKSVIRATKRFLPSASSGSVILKKKDEEQMTALEVLCENECEGTEIENDQKRFKEFQNSMEEQFYRGGKASWWNFYFSTRVPFIKRDAYTSVFELIHAKSTSKMCVKIISLFHHPGCGGTTLAMHILWDSRKKFRCTVLRNSQEDVLEIGRQVIDLVTYGVPCNSEYLPALLMVDDTEEFETVHVLQNSIQIAVAEKGLRFEWPLVIILNCMRSQDPARSSKMIVFESIALKYKLSVEEQHLFELKLEEIEEKHSKPEDFYSFMIMKQNFDQKYIENVVHNILKDLDIASKQAQLISFLALLNWFVNDSSISVSKCEQFLGLGQVKNTFWGPEKFEDLIGTYSTLVIRTEVEEYGRYQGIRIIHPLIASRCLEEFKSCYDFPKSKIALTWLMETIFLQRGIGKEKLVKDTYSMLITRQRKIYGDEADTQFSPLIEAIQNEEGSDQVIEVLTEASNKFDENPFISQALARHFYLNKKDFGSALKWAFKAKEKAKDNSYIRDTLGQVFKSKLKHNIESSLVDAGKHTVVTPSQLAEFLHLAQSASDAFRESQTLTEMKEDKIGWQEQRTRMRSDVYNTSGYLGEIEVALYVIDIAKMIPFFSDKNKLNENNLMCFLSGNMNLQHRNEITRDAEELCSILDEYNRYLINIQSSMKRAFDFFEDYFVYFKTRNIEREAADVRIRRKVSECFSKYTKVFYLKQIEKISVMQGNPKLSQSLILEEHKKFLEFYKVDRFAGLLEFLTNNSGNGNKMEEIVVRYKFILQNSPNQNSIRYKQNFILANIVLNCIKPQSKEIESYDKLRKYLKEVLQVVEFSCGYVEPYFLGSLLFWPTEKETEDDKFLLKCTTAIRQSFRMRYGRMSHSKHPVAHFYLCKRKGLKRFVHKAKIDQYFQKVSHLNSLWQSGEIWKENEVRNLLTRMNGRTGEDNKVYLEFGKFKVPVRPVFLGKLRCGLSIENVSFFLGFSMDGPIAYDVDIAGSELHV
ncbi:sterile alpha motif domain-containing protein 9-like [Narcine bancroftii]|uniref:sterile alpha motif domain-containing protein 9-like n=1 Tax=Narcine bancroftii TaxID=1343680 RepID=UPI0038314FAC